jgi:hypothetical protein
MTITALRTAIFGGDDILKAIDAEDLGLSCEEFTTGDQIFLKHDSPDVAVGALLVKVAASPAVTSEARFEKVCNKIRIIFAADPEAAESAIEIAKNLRTQVRVELIAAA